MVLIDGFSGGLVDVLSEGVGCIFMDDVFVGLIGIKMGVVGVEKFGL